VEFRSSRKAFSASANPDKLRLFAALGDVVAKGTLTSSKAPRDSALERSTKAYHFLTASVEMGGRRIRMGVTVREDTNGHLYYNHNPIPDEETPPSGTEDTAHEAGPGTEGGGAAKAGRPHLPPAGTRHNKDGPGTEGEGTSRRTDIDREPKVNKPENGGLKEDARNLRPPRNALAAITRRLAGPSNNALRGM